MATNHHSLFVMDGGVVKGFGYNNQGQLGTGDNTSPILVAQTIDIEAVKQIACGGNHTVFLMEDGTVKACGQNSYSQCGQGNTNSLQYDKLVIPNLTGVKQVACGAHHSVFLMGDGTVKACGRNSRGQCGQGNTTDPQTAVLTIPNLSGVKQVACGAYHTVFLMEDGTVKACGYNSDGQCGQGNTSTSQTEIITIPDLTGVKQVSCGYKYTVFLMEDGTVKAVGEGAHGQLGQGNAITPQLEVLAIPALAGVKQVSCGNNHTVFLMEDTTVRAVGHNVLGSCGQGNEVAKQLEVLTIPAVTGVKEVACGQYHTALLKTTGEVLIFGKNSDGQCGTGNTSTKQLEVIAVPDLTAKALWVPSMVITMYLLKIGADCYTFKPFKEVVTSITPTEADFVDNGFEDITAVNNAQVTGDLALTKDGTWAGSGSLFRKSFDPADFSNLTINSVS